MAIPCIDEANTHIFDQLQNIEEMFLHSNFHYFNLDSFVNLKSLLIRGYIQKDFNFDLFKNLANQLEHLGIYFQWRL